MLVESDETLLPLLASERRTNDSVAAADGSHRRDSRTFVLCGVEEILAHFLKQIFFLKQMTLYLEMKQV